MPNKKRLFRLVKKAIEILQKSFLFLVKFSCGIVGTKEHLFSWEKIMGEVSRVCALIPSEIALRNHLMSQTEPPVCCNSVQNENEWLISGDSVRTFGVLQVPTRGGSHQGSREAEEPGAPGPRCADRWVLTAPHPHADTRTYTHTHSHTHAYSSQAHTRTNTPHTRTQTHAYIHTHHRHTHTLIQYCTHTIIRARTHTHTHPHTYMCTHIHTQEHTHAYHTDAHSPQAHRHMCTQTHTYTCMLTIGTHRDTPTHKNCTDTNKFQRSLVCTQVFLSSATKQDSSGHNQNLKLLHAVPCLFYDIGVDADVFLPFTAKPIRPGQQMGLRAMAQNGPVPIRGGGGAANNAWVLSPQYYCTLPPQCYSYWQRSPGAQVCRYSKRRATIFAHISANGSLWIIRKSFFWSSFLNSVELSKFCTSSTTYFEYWHLQRCTWSLPQLQPIILCSVQGSFALVLFLFCFLGRIKRLRPNKGKIILLEHVLNCMQWAKIFYFFFFFFQISALLSVLLAVSYSLLCVSEGTDTKF